MDTQKSAPLSNKSGLRTVPDGSISLDAALEQLASRGRIWAVEPEEPPRVYRVSVHRIME